MMIRIKRKYSRLLGLLVAVCCGVGLLSTLTPEVIDSQKGILESKGSFIGTSKNGSRAIQRRVQVRPPSRLHNFRGSILQSLISVFKPASPAPGCAMTHIDPCDYKNPPLLLAYVCSAPNNTEFRNLVRRTWAHSMYHGNITVKVIFVIGKVGLNSREISALEKEHDAYRDVFLADFKDDYYNLTLKGLAALEWCSACCAKATYVLKVDDDVFVNIFSLLGLLKRLKVNGRTRRVVYCRMLDQLVLRTGRQAVSIEEYPEKYYPPFCGGPAYVMSSDIVPKLVDLAYKTPIFKLEDVYFTGMLMRKISLRHRKFNEGYFRNLESSWDEFIHGEKWRTHVFSHHEHFLGIDRYERAWKKLLQVSLGEIVKW